MAHPARLDRADVCIVTVVNIEREQTKQVLEHVAKKRTEQMRIFDDAGNVKRDCHAVDWTFMGDKRPLKVALFQQAEIGRSEASQLVNDIAQLKPALVAMVGVCAGVENEVKVGDLLVPLELQIVSGKVRENGEMDRQPTIAQLRSRMTLLVLDAAANMDPYAWQEFLPDQWRDCPLRAPSYFQDKILYCLKDEDKGMTAMEMMRLKGFGDVEADWMEEAVEKLLYEGYLQKEGRRRKQDVVKVSEKGRIYIVENIDEEELEATRNPKVLTGPVLTIDVVSENLEFGDLRKAAANRKLVGADMEGYSFLFSADNNMQYENAVFIKAVSDFGSKRSKMDYYQPYCASSAAAFLCYLIKRNPQLFPDLAHGPGGGGNGTSDGAMHPAGTFPKYHEVMALIGDTPKVEDFKRLKLSVAKIGSTSWEGIGTELLDERQVADIKGSSSSNSVKLNSIIANWIVGSKEPATVKKLLVACANNQVGNSEIMAEFNRRKEEEELEQAIYERALTSGSITVERLRVMFVGQDGSGKTSLIRSLLGKQFDEDIPSTDGVVITNTKKLQKQADSFLDECLELGFHLVAKPEKEEPSLPTVSSPEPMPTEAATRSTSVNIPVFTVTAPVETVEEKAEERQPQKKEGKVLSSELEDLSELTQKHKESLRKFIRKANEKLSKTKNVQIEHLWDLGGQATYLSTHCLLLPSSHLRNSLTAFVLVINLAARLTDPAESSFRLRNGRSLDCTEDLGWIEKNEDFVRAWLSNFINAFPETVDSQSRLGQTEDVKDPPIFIAGTHYDIPKAKNILEEQRKIITSIIEGRQYESHVVLPGDDGSDNFFLIENTKSDKCSGVQNLRQRINQMRKNYYKSEKPQPLRWILLEFAIANLKEENPILNMKSITHLAVDTCGLSGEQEVKMALNHLDGLGIVFRFLEVPDEVFINPEWLVQALAIFVTAKRPERLLIADWRNVQKTGKMSKRLVDARLAGAKVPQEKKSVVLDLLHCLDIAISVPLQEGEPSGSGDLFFPCLLTSKCDVSSTLWQKMNPSSPFPPPLALVPLNVDAVPEALFFRLVVRFLQKYIRLADGVGRHRCLFTTSSGSFNFELSYNCRGKAVILTVGGDPDYLKGPSWICEVTELRKYFESQVEDVRDPGMGEFKYETGFYLEKLIKETTKLRSVEECVLYKPLYSGSHVLRNSKGEQPPIELQEKVSRLWFGIKINGRSTPAAFPNDDEVMTLIGDNPKVEDFKCLQLSVAEAGQQFWEGIGTELLSQNQLADIKGEFNSVKLAKVIYNWIIGSKKPTVGELLKACSNKGVNEKTIKEEFHRRKGMHE